MHRNYHVVYSQTLINYMHILILAMQWLLSPEPVPEKPLAPIVEDLLMSQAYHEAQNKRTYLARALLLTPSLVEEIAVKTVGQRESHLWGLIRKNRLTASNFGCILKAIKNKRYAML